MYFHIANTNPVLQIWFLILHAICAKIHIRTIWSPYSYFLENFYLNTLLMSTYQNRSHLPFQRHPWFIKTKPLLKLLPHLWRVYFKVCQDLKQHHCCALCYFHLRNIRNLISPETFSSFLADELSPHINFNKAIYEHHIHFP